MYWPSPEECESTYDDSRCAVKKDDRRFDSPLSFAMEETAQSEDEISEIAMADWKTSQEARSVQYSRQTSEDHLVSTTTYTHTECKCNRGIHQKTSTPTNNIR